MSLLIIEDDKKIADYTKLSLLEEGFSVDIAYTGEDGLELVYQNRYDAIILDWMLPGIDGLEVCQTIRAKSIITPIIMLTAKVFVEDRVKSLNSGADDYIAKPFYFEELLARINAQIRRMAYTNNPIIDIDSLTINMQKREVFRENKLIELTSKEYEILELLVVNRGHVVNNKTIMEEVWKDENDINHNLINVYMHHLRYKIDKKNQKPLITTIRKHGFKLDA